MKFVSHDTYRTFDYVEVVNRVFDMMLMNDMDYTQLGKATGLSGAVVGKFFRYQAVSMPTLLRLAEWASINLAYIIIEQD